MENDLDSPDVHSLASAARTAVENGDLDAAERHYQKLTQQSSVASEWFARLGYVQLQLGRFEDAVGSMTAAASGSPEDAGVLTGLGNALLRLGRIEASLNALQRAVKLAPQRIDTLNALGLAYAASGSIEVASETFASALAVAPDATAVLTNWIDILMRAQRAEQASVVLEQLVLDRPDDAAAWFKLGQVQMSIGRLSQAAHALERSAQLIPTHSPTFQNLGLVAMWVAKTPEAEAYFREVLAPFGALSDEHWCHITRHSVAWHASRERYVMLFDPQIVRAFRNPWHYSLDLWKYWTGIEVPILVLRGVKSDMLPSDLVLEMVRRNPRTRVHEVEGCGHAPPLMSLEQIKPVVDFLTA